MNFLKIRSSPRLPASRFVTRIVRTFARAFSNLSRILVSDFLGFSLEKKNMLSSGIPFRRFHRVYERLNPPTRIYALVAALLDLARVPVTDQRDDKRRRTDGEKTFEVVWENLKIFSFSFLKR